MRILPLTTDKIVKLKFQINDATPVIRFDPTSHLKLKTPITLATWITMVRILLVPAFAVLAVKYSTSVTAGEPAESLRWWAIATFVTAAVSDGLDGFIARHFNQKSKLGATLDPIADKLLLITAIITLSLAPWGDHNWHIPFWVAALVISRDIIILGGIAILYYLKRDVPIEPSWLGKICTVSQMALIACVMLKCATIPIIYPATITALFTLWSGIRYVHHGFQIHHKALQTS
jgi:CDP-diacylglycerol--glycerol-3-phosphate 3-phosphatidyltransferase/cardiolipin synthase